MIDKHFSDNKLLSINSFNKNSLIELAYRRNSILIKIKIIDYDVS